MEYEPKTKKGQIAELNDNFERMTREIMSSVRDAGAHFASSDLRRMYPEVDWSNYPSERELEKMADDETKRAIQGVRDAISNRKQARLLEHERELDSD